MDYFSVLRRLCNREDLSYDDMQELVRSIMGGMLTPAQIAAALVALHMKGESVTEITAAAQVIRNLSAKVKVHDVDHLIDTCGTGGDGAQTFNISTACALVAAAAGARVAKHGGRSVSSTCGSADILEKLGVNVNFTPQQVARCVQEIGVGFMFAPNHHSAMKNAAPVRRELGVRTLFNLLGPLTNPAGAQSQVMGVSQRELTGKLARVLQQLGSSHVLVVHGADGLDEISISGPTYVAELKNGNVIEYMVRPEDFGLRSAPLDSIRVVNADEARTILLSVLDNHPSAARDIVQLNAGAAIYVAGLAASLQEGVKKAGEVIASGAAKKKLDELVSFKCAGE